MKFEEMLLQRESCRAYADRPVAREDLLKICDAGRLSPSACNSQPWKFMIVDNAEAKAKLCDALVVANGKSGAPWREECPAFIVLVEQKAKLVPMAMDHCQDSQWFAKGDIGMACLNMCYQAMELGLSTCILGLVDQEKMRTYFGLPEDRNVYVTLAVGYSKENAPARPKVRKAFDDVVCANQWNACANAAYFDMVEQLGGHDDTYVYVTQYDHSGIRISSKVFSWVDGCGAVDDYGIWKVAKEYAQKLIDAGIPMRSE